MPRLSAALSLDLWEGAEGLNPVERALTLAAAAHPPADRADLELLPLGRRDARLLRLWRELVGPWLEATAACPACREYVEFSADADALIAGDQQASPEPIEAKGFVVTWRPPDSRDVAAAAETGDLADAKRVLLQRCITSASGPDGELDGPSLPPTVREAVAEAMAAADPLAEVLLDLDCPVCGGAFVADLDLAGFVWDELRAAAWRLLREVDTLARAYGWSEAEVLALGDRRRAAYSSLVFEGLP